MEVKVNEGKGHCARLLRRVEASEEITILRGNTLVARLIPIASSRVAAQGMDQGRVWIAEDFEKILTLLMLLLKRFLKVRLRKGPLVPRDDPSKSPVDTQHVKRVLDHDL